MARSSQVMYRTEGCNGMLARLYPNGFQGADRASVVSPVYASFQSELHIRSFDRR